MKKQFDIKYRPQIESGEYKVETREGRPVKIISFEMTDTDDCPIAAQFRLCAGSPVVYLFDKEGHYKGEGDSEYDLFIITPEEELTEFEKKVKEIADCKEDCSYLGNTIYKSIAAELRAIAFKEFKENEATHMKEFIDYEWIVAYEKGKAEALKDMPRWKKARYNPDICMISDKHELYFQGYKIGISDIMKLPGFKEEESGLIEKGLALEAPEKMYKTE